MTEAKTTKTSVKAVYGSLLKVMEGLKSVPKNGKMKFGNTEYDYLRADDVQEKLNPLLLENNLIVQPSYEVVHTTRGRGEGVPFVEVHLTLNYISTLDGSELPVSAAGESKGDDDKSINKALTQAIKNSHRVQFQFASGEKEADDIPPSSEPRAVTQAKASAAPDIGALRAELVALSGDQGKATQEGNDFFKIAAGEPALWASDPGKIRELIIHLKNKG